MQLVSIPTTIHAALDAGVNFFDTAAVYGNGESESLLQTALAGRRDQVVIASKVRPDMMAPDDLVRGCEESLRRLGTDYLDLYQTHWANPEVPFEDSWATLIRLRDQGKIRWAGVCNAGTEHLKLAAGIQTPVTNQLPWNLLWRAIEEEILPQCRQAEIGILAYSPLMHGLLADKYQNAADVPDGRARSRHFSTDRQLARHGEAGCENQTFAAIAAIREIASELDRTMADVSLNWVAAQPGVTCVIAGAGSPEQLGANVLALARPLSDESVRRLSAATEPLRELLGPNPDMWQGATASRFQ